MFGSQVPGGFERAFGIFAPQVHQSLNRTSYQPPFEYRPLEVTDENVTEIRLLEIVPLYSGGQVAPGQLSIQLTHHAFDSSLPPFIALSYNWGDQKDKYRIRCNDGVIDIGKSLNDALLALRNRQVRTPNQPKHLWIDALCINQLKDEEKAQQVPLMKELYRRASHVLVWLGEPAVDSQYALPFMQVCASASHMIGRVSAHQMTMQDWMRLGFTMSQQERYKSTRALIAFVSRPWFKRVWIIQEYAVARSVTFLCGQHEFQPEQLFAAYSFLSITQSLSIPISEKCEGGMGAIEHLSNIRADWQAGQTLPLLTLLRHHQSFHATEWKDKVYALMQMASDVGDHSTNLNILVNYEQEEEIRNGKIVLVDVIPVQVIYRSVAIEMIQKQRNLDVLSSAGIHEIWTTERLKPWESEPYHARLHGLPSWVPDWHLPDSTSNPQHFERPFRIGMGAWSNIQCNMTPYKFRASGNSTFIYRHTANVDHLRVRGIFLDVISDSGLPYYSPLPDLQPQEIQEGLYWMTEPSMNDNMQQVERSFTVFKSWLDITAAQSTQVYFTGETMLDVLWQTMMGGVFPSGIEADRMLFMQWYQASRTLMSLMLGLRERSWLRTVAVEAYSAYKSSPQGLGIISNFLFRTASMISNKAVFRTRGTLQSFGYVGLAPRGIQRGDWVALLEGANVPFVLRQRGPNWEIVGTCYVHGAMFGQLFDPAICVDMLLV